ncbi:rRNA maturation RNase YbeY [Alcaligenes sp. SDU_A2]|uniref:rRNA maturation RNase YbeY n=1 Tax=Alcaligenes sp. SDU_A2 TaxID=3136634 RepID=UPI002C3D6F58|nr:rRNA maturation RNase YbeY [Alcaligenes sp.]HRL27756.1 rRNA maturation RNase YbeY [Alcaligenes sp.]
MPDLSLSVQYATSCPELTRPRLRRWVQCALDQAWERTHPDDRFSGLSVTLRIVDAEEGRSLNQGYRDKDYATNVLTFEYGQDPEGIVHGDIVLCLPVLEREAAEQEKPLLHHAAHLVVHGTLHSLGYDHIDEQDALDMEALETTVLARLRIPDPYQER